MTPRYPLAFEGIPAWASTQQLSVAEARTRFAQYAILRAIAGSRTLAAILVFKGGNALDFVWQPNRSTRDLDFTMDMAVRRDPIDLEHLREIFVRSLAVSTRELAVALQVQRVRQQPPGLEKTFITYDVRVGYALPDEQPLRDRMQSGQSSTRVIPLEIAMNEVIGDAEVVALDATHQLRVCTVEDIVAEKLRALLQQPLRNRLAPPRIFSILPLSCKGEPTWIPTEWPASSSPRPGLAGWPSPGPLFTTRKWQDVRFPTTMRCA